MSKRILFFVAHPEQDAGSRFRIYQFAPFLEKDGFECVIAPFSTPTLFQALRSKGALPAKVREAFACTLRRAKHVVEASQFDAVVINREVFPFLMPLWEKAVLRKNQRVVFNFDDAIYAGHHDVSSFAHPWLYRLKYGNGVDEVIRRSAHVIAGNRILGEYARRYNANVTVVPTVVDCDYYRYREVKVHGQQPIVIGWMGSSSTAPYLKLIEPVLKQLSRRFPGEVCYRFFGCPEYKPDLPDSLSLPFSLSSEIEDLQGLDIGIMPMPDTEWTRGKCAFKAIQYMATGPVVIASPVGVTTDLVRHGENGLLAQSSDEWYEGLARLIGDINLRKSLSLRGRRTIVEEYSLSKWAPVYVGILSELAEMEVASTFHSAGAFIA